MYPLTVMYCSPCWQIDTSFLSMCDSTSSYPKVRIDTDGENSVWFKSHELVVPQIEPQTRSLNPKNAQAELVWNTFRWHQAPPPVHSTPPRSDTSTLLPNMLTTLPWAIKYHPQCTCITRKWYKHIRDRHTSRACWGRCLMPPKSGMNPSGAQRIKP